MLAGTHMLFPRGTSWYSFWKLLLWMLPDHPGYCYVPPLTFLCYSHPDFLGGVRVRTTTMLLSLTVLSQGRGCHPAPSLWLPPGCSWATAMLNWYNSSSSAKIGWPLFSSTVSNKTLFPHFLNVAFITNTWQWSWWVKTYALTILKIPTYEWAFFSSTMQQ